MEAAHDLGRDREIATPFHHRCSSDAIYSNRRDKQRNSTRKEDTNLPKAGTAIHYWRCNPSAVFNDQTPQSVPVIRKLLIAAWRRWSRSLIAWPNYSFHQEFAATYFPMKTLEISAEAGLTFNGKNPATVYQSGATFDIDWGINWAPIASMPNLFFGIQGFYVTQFTDDEINNVTVAPGGFRL
jgi:hypothetical protein